MILRRGRGFDSEKREARSEKREARSEKREARSENSSALERCTKRSEDAGEASASRYYRDVNPEPIRSHRDLIVWQRARALSIECRQVCKLLPAEARYALADQILRAAVSVGGNIAEGRGRLSKADNVRHLAIARGSLLELMSHLDFATGMDYIAEVRTTRAHELATEVQRMLNVQIRKPGNRKL